ncbi:MAG TPA: S8 family serine peptidase, partial [Nocardioides sp.]
MRLIPSPHRRRFAPIALATTAAVALLAGPSLATTAVAAPYAANTSVVKIDPALQKAVSDGGEATFFVVLKDQASLAQARSMKGKNAKVKATYGELRSAANRTQKSLTAYLDAKKVGHEDFWITNSVLVTGDEALVDELALRNDVAELVPEKRYALDVPESESAPEAATTATPEWGITEVKADQVWAKYADRGEGVVIANIDSGVQFDHPALVDSYRGNDGSGTFTHDYNFFDPTGTCTDGAPCDNNGHGTHTMGTMVGADGIGVAPGATWMAAKGCEARSCSDSSLLKAGQWVLAPTDHNGENPRPELAPDVVNNS